MEISEAEKFYLSLIKYNNLTIFDIGANKGFYTDYLINHFGVKHKYYLFEPSERFFKVLLDKFGECGNIKMHNTGVSNFELDNVDFYELFSDDNDVEGMSSLNERHVFRNYNYKLKKIKTISLDNFIKLNEIKKINFIKIDTEGNELKILNGLSLSLKQKIVDFIQIEYGDCSIENGFNLNDILNFLNDYDYSLFLFVEGELIKIDTNNSNQYLNLSWANFLIKKNEI